MMVGFLLLQNLHMLADIGISILKALNTWGISMSNTPDKILLPSSLYRISSAKKSEEASSQADIGIWL